MTGKALGVSMCLDLTEPAGEGQVLFRCDSLITR
jgi:hypothetical protein